MPSRASRMRRPGRKLPRSNACICNIVFGPGADYAVYDPISRLARRHVLRKSDGRWWIELSPTSDEERRQHVFSTIWKGSVWTRGHHAFFSSTESTTLLKGSYVRPRLEMGAFIREIIRQLKRQSWARRRSNRSRRQILSSPLRNRGGLSGRDRLPSGGGTSFGRRNA